MKRGFSIFAIVLAFVLSFALVGCGNKAEEKKPAEKQQTEQTQKKDEGKKEEAKKDEAKKPESAAGALEVHRGLVAAHGDKGFTEVVVLVQGDKIVASHIDEYQFFDKGAEGVTPVPNSDGAFGKGYAENKVLISKLTNDAAYSKLMAEHAKATTPYSKSMEAIVKFADGKTVAELEKAAKEMKESKKIDAVSGATLVDTPNYLQAIADIAKKSQVPAVPGAKVENTDNIKTATVIGAPHGDKGFGTATVFVQDGKIVAASVDEYQFVDAGDGLTVVPNSDKEFGKGYAEGKVLISKSLNNDFYSNLMKEHAKATKKYLENMGAIEADMLGKSAEEAGKVDSVSGSTLADTAGYAKLIGEAAAAAK